KLAQSLPPKGSHNIALVSGRIQAISQKKIQRPLQRLTRSGRRGFSVGIDGQRTADGPCDTLTFFYEFITRQREKGADLNVELSPAVRAARHRLARGLQPARPEIRHARARLHHGV